MKKGNGSNKTSSSGSHPGFEATLWATADKLRGNLDAAEYKHVVLGLTLAALRDTRLPKLHLGEFRVPALVKEAEAAG